MREQIFLIRLENDSRGPAATASQVSLLDGVASVFYR